MFVHDPNSPLQAGCKPALSPSHRKSSSAFHKDVLDLTAGASTPRGSVCSLESGVFQTWLSASKKFNVEGGDEEKGQAQVLGHGRGPRPVLRPLILSMSPTSSRSSTISVPDDEGIDADKSRRIIVRESVILGGPTKEATFIAKL
jgi:hypothetical protein